MTTDKILTGKIIRTRVFCVRIALREIDKNWEGKTFDFTVSLKNDTLTQTGLEKVEKENINRTIIEKYVKVKL